MHATELDRDGSGGPEEELPSGGDPSELGAEDPGADPADAEMPSAARPRRNGANGAERKVEPLAPEQKALIRGRLIQILATGAFGEELERAKAKLVQDTGCHSIVQIDAIHAHLTGKAVKVLKAANLEDKLIAGGNKDERKSATQKVLYCVVRLDQCSDGREVNKVLAELSSELGLATADLRAIYRALEKTTKTKPGKTEEGDGGGAEALGPSGVGIRILDGRERAAALRAGVQEVAFTYPSKLEWRSRWQDFMERRLSELEPSAVRDFVVGALPGIECRTELKHYLDLGIRPQNIYAFEAGSSKVGKADRRAQVDRFLANIGALQTDHPGVHGVGEMVADALTGTLKSVRFNAFNLDFEGSLSRKCLDTLASLHLAPRSILILNLLAARETIEMKRALHEIHTIYCNPDRRAKEIGESALEPPASAGDEVALVEARASGFEYILLANVGLGRTENRGPHADSVAKLQSMIERSLKPEPRGAVYQPRMVGAELEPAAMVTMFIEQSERLSNALFQVLRPWSRSDGEVVTPSDLELLPWLAADVCFGRSKIVGVEKWLYHSESSHSRAPYMSCFASIETPLEVYRRWDEAAGFMMALRLSMTPDGRDKRLMLVDQEMSVKQFVPGGDNRIVSGDRIALVIDGVPQKSISADVELTLRQLREYADWTANFPLQDPKNLAEIPRRTIS